MSNSPTIQPPIVHSTLTVAQLCARNQISRVHFYELRKHGRGPKIMKMGRRTLITLQSESDWHAQMEAASLGVE